MDANIQPQPPVAPFGSELAQLIDGPLDSPELLTASLERLINGGVAASLVHELLRTPNALAAVGARSYAHANGFNKIVLAAGEDNRWKLRLHVWDHEPTAATLENIHDHRWDFASAVIMGRLETEYYEVAEDPSGPLTAYEYFSPETSDQYDFNPFSPAAVTSLERAALTSDTTYGLPYHMFHRVDLTTGPAATLVLQGAVKQLSTTVVRESGRLPNITHITRMHPHRVAEYIRLLAASL